MFLGINQPAGAPHPSPRGEASDSLQGFPLPASAGGLFPGKTESHFGCSCLFSRLWNKHAHLKEQTINVSYSVGELGPKATCFSPGAAPPCAPSGPALRPLPEPSLHRTLCPDGCVSLGLTEHRTMERTATQCCKLRMWSLSCDISCAKVPTMKPTYGNTELCI